MPWPSTDLHHLRRRERRRLQLQEREPCRAGCRSRRCLGDRVLRMRLPGLGRALGDLAGPHQEALVVGGRRAARTATAVVVHVALFDEAFLVLATVAPALFLLAVHAGPVLFLLAMRPAAVE